MFRILYQIHNEVKKRVKLHEVNGYSVLRRYNNVRCDTRDLSPLNYSKSRRHPFHELDLIRRIIHLLSHQKRGNVDFADKPSHTRASSIPVYIPVSLLHAERSTVFSMAGVVESAAD